MKKILILRHATTEQNIGGDDFERKLLQKGVDDCHKLYDRLHKLGFNPEYILASNSVRTTTTAELVFPENSIELSAELYRANGKRILDIIQKIDGKYTNIAIIAHNPGVSEFCNDFISNLNSEHLLDIKSGMRPLSAALFTLPDSTKWNEVEKTGGELTWYFNP